jgi:EmrB/QacA subfamily drug resistance transporter
MNAPTLPARAVAEPGPPSPAPNIRTVFTGLILVLTLGALDQSIVATALPRIVSDLGAVSHLTWVVTSYIVTSTMAMPLYGKLSDQHGRKPLLYVAVGIFLLGSVLAGLSQTMTELIVFRAVQGLGAGGLLPLAQITIGDLLSPRERGRYQGVFGAVFAGCTIAGPILGGIITDLLSWHWIFYLNLPVGAVAIGFIAVGLPRPPEAVAHRIDYAGAVLIALGTTGLLFVLSLGGTTYAWSSPEIIGATAATIVVTLLLIVQERRTPEPILPLHLFANATVAISWAVLALTFTGISAATVFFPLFFQLVLGVAPSLSGLLTGPLMLGVVVSSVLGGRLVTRTGRYKPLPVFGLAAGTLAFAALGWAAATGRGIAFIEPLLIVLGCGIGLVMPTMTVALQNAVDPADMGAATGTSAFFRSLGGVIGVALSGGIMAMCLQAAAAASGLLGPIDPKTLMSSGVQQIAQLPPSLAAAVIGFYRDAIAATFFVGGAIAALAFLLVLFLPELPLRTTRPQSSAPATAPASSAAPKSP